MKKIAFLLPVCEKTPGGGSKVMFEYANYFANNGYIVTIYFCAWKIGNKKRFPKFIQRILAKSIVKIRPRWFKLDKKIRKKAVFSISDNEIEDNDVLITTHVSTIKDVSKLKDSKGIKINLIQDLENWNVSDDELFETYRLGLINVAVARWLAKIVEEKSGKKCEYVSNGIDTGIFKEILPVEERNPHSIILHYREHPIKGCKYALKTLDILSKKYEDLQITIISKDVKPKEIPNKYKYVYNVTAKEVAKFNNEAAIFMCSSIKEGFGLPGLEAMACGCALVTTDYLGGREYAKNNINALVSPIKDYETMAKNIELLMNDNKKRIEIARKGIEDAKTYSVLNSAQKLEKIILKNLESKIKE